MRRECIRPTVGTSRNCFLDGLQLNVVEGRELEEIRTAQFIDERPQLWEEDVVRVVDLQFKLIDNAKLTGSEARP